MVFQLAYGLETVVLRVFNVYGSRQGFCEYGGVIAQFVKRLLVGEPPVVYDDGMQTRDFVYVDDVVEAVLMSLINSDVGGGVFNIRSGKPTAINELLELLLQITEREVDPIYSEQRLGDIRHSYADLGKAHAPRKLPDALTVATAINKGADLIYSQDEDIQRFGEDVKISKIE